MTRYLLAALLALPAPALAQDDPPVDTGDTATIGVGVGYAPSYEGSDDYNIIPAAAVRGQVSGINFFTRGTQLYVDVIPAPASGFDFEFGPIVGVRLNRTSRIKDPQVRALGKLDEAIELGGFVGLNKTGVITSAYDNLAFRVAYVRDVSNTHDSYVITPSIEYGTPLSEAVYVGIGASADYAGDGYARTYFDVSPTGAAASGLAPFSTDGGFKNVSFNLLANYAFSGDLRRGLSLFGLGGYSKLLGDFKRSPIVSDAGSSNQWFAAVGLAYTF